MFGADCFFWRFQVKINGQRVELGEIEYACSKSDLVQDVVVQLYENRILVAYVEPSPPIMVSQEKGQNASRKAKILQWQQMRVPGNFSDVPIQLESPHSDELHFKRYTSRSFSETCPDLTEKLNAILLDMTSMPPNIDIELQACEVFGVADIGKILAPLYQPK